MNLDSAIPTEPGLCSDMFGLRVHISEQTKCGYVHSCIDAVKEQRFLLFLDALIFFFFLKTIFCCSLISSLCSILPQRDATLSDGCVLFFFSLSLSESVQGIELYVSKSRPSLFHKIVFMVKRKLYTKLVIII